MKKVIIDLLGADAPQEELLTGVLLAGDANPEYQFEVVGDSDVLTPLIQGHQNVSVLDAKTTITNDSNPLILAKGGNDTSVGAALLQLKNDPDAIGMVSAGATGALIVGATFKLGLLPNMKRPALIANLVSIKNKPVSLIDCGANLDIDPERMVQFATLGSLFYSAYLGVEKPRVGLLNNGKEEHKGNKVTKEAYQLLKASPLNFVGNIEGSDVFLDIADVIACDGFSGNMILKNAEATAMIAKKLAMNCVSDATEKEEINSLINHFFDYNELGGAILLGACKPIIKAHGKAKPQTMVSVIKDIIRLDNNHFIEKMKEASL